MIYLDYLKLLKRFRREPPGVQCIWRKQRIANHLVFFKKIFNKIEIKKKCITIVSYPYTEKRYCRFICLWLKIKKLTYYNFSFPWWSVKVLCLGRRRHSSNNTDANVILQALEKPWVKCKGVARVFTSARNYKP